VIAELIDFGVHATNAQNLLQRTQGEELNSAPVRGFVAEVMQTNLAILNLARRLGHIEITTDAGAYHVTLLFA